ncbi:MAG: gliding motility protein GldL [Bacteroidota bacterium]|nr:gliding motility protein GldL [Bacteroidota bacterium]MDP3145279.1 gliding motility protein GldL [Bacteroidota bacterium]MDP3556892.1 gliding motility protein GldL [Bacteroidota bacterium]
MSKLGKVKGFKKFVHMASCIGAAVVILGALFKIMHWPLCNEMLIVGLSTEAFLFCLFASDVPHEEVDWTLAYPELAGMGGALEEEEEKSNLPITEQLDNLLADAKIGPELIESLGAGMRAIGDNATKMADISNATVATNEYVDNVKKASSSVSTLADTYKSAANSIQSLAESNDAGHSIGESLNKVSKNLSALNATYELQLQGSKTHLDATSKFYDGLHDLMKNLHDSVDDTKKYRSEMSQLSTNLTALNTVYGNMLSAMNFNKG